MTLKFTLHGQHIIREDNICLPQGMANYAECEFSFSNEWNNLTKTAIFSNGSICYHVLLTGSRCIVPEDIMTGTFGLSVFGVSEKGGDLRRITADTVLIEIIENGYVKGKTPGEPSEEQNEQITAQIDKIKAEIEKNEQNFSELQKKTDEYSASAGADMKTLKNSCRDCSDAVGKLRQKTAEIPSVYSQKSHTHTAEDIDALPPIPHKTSDIENDCGYTQDTGYNHTDNNFTSSDKHKLDELCNYDDTAIKSRIEKKMKILKADSSGYPAVLENQSAAKNLICLQIYGSSAGVGEFDVATGKYVIPVKLFGKNIIPFPYRDKNKKTNGVTWTTYADGSVSVSGSTTDTATYTFFDPIPVISGAKYTFTSGASDKKNIDFRITAWDKNKNFISQIIIASDVHTIEIADNVYYIGLYMSRTAANTECTGVFKPQLEYGSTATAYEAYAEPSKAAIALDAALKDGEYIDLIRKKRIKGCEKTDITVEGEIKTIGSNKNFIACETSAAPTRIDITYEQDAGKVLSELKSAVLSSGANT